MNPLTAYLLLNQQNSYKLMSGGLTVSVASEPAEAGIYLTASMKTAHSAERKVFSFRQGAAGISDLKPWFEPGRFPVGPPGFSYQVTYSTGSGTRLVVVPPSNSLQWTPALTVDMPIGRLRPVEWVDIDGDGALEVIVITDPKWKRVGAKMNFDTGSSLVTIYGWSPAKGKYKILRKRRFDQRLKS